MGKGRSKKCKDEQNPELNSEPPKKKTHFLFETDIDKKSWVVKVFQLIFPLALSFIAFLVIIYFNGLDDSFQIGMLIAMYYVPIWGKEFIIPVGAC